MLPVADRIKQIAATPAAPANSARWLAVDRIIRLGISFVVQLIVIRHLGPEGNGILQNGLALAALVAVVAELGLDSVLRRELVRTPERAGQLLGTATALRLIALLPGLAVFICIAHAQPGASPMLVGWLAVTVALPLAQTPDAWLLATGRVPASVAASGAGYLASALLRLTLAIAGAGVAAFAAAAGLETLVIGTGLVLALFASTAAPRRWSFNADLARTLLRGAFPLLLTTLAITVYRRIDVVLVTRLLDTRAAGVYAAAVRLSEIGYLAPMVLLNVGFPQLTRLHAEDPVAYRVALGDFFRRVTWAGAAFAGGLTLAAPWLARGLLGSAFAAAAVPLAIHAWTAVFIAHGIARSQWLLLENRQIDGLWLALAGAAANVALNLVLVPRLGVNGAALAAVGALALNMAVFPALSARTRPGWSLGWRAVFTRG